MDYYRFWGQYYLVQGGVWAVQNPEQAFGLTVGVAVATKQPALRYALWEIAKFEIGQGFGRLRFYFWRLPSGMMQLPKTPPAPTLASTALRAGGVGVAGLAIGVGAYALTQGPQQTYDFLSEGSYISENREVIGTPQFFLDGFA